MCVSVPGEGDRRVCVRLTGDARGGPVSEGVSLPGRAVITPGSYSFTLCGKKGLFYYVTSGHDVCPEKDEWAKNCCPRVRRGRVVWTEYTTFPTDTN